MSKGKLSVDLFLMIVDLLQSHILQCFGMRKDCSFNLINDGNQLELQIFPYFTNLELLRRQAIFPRGEINSGPS